MSRILIALVACTAISALAESNTLKGRPGFFKATPDGNSSISRSVPPPENLVPEVASSRLVPDPIPQAEPPADERARQSETDMDRANREHAVMAERSARTTPIAPGAYNGATNERDR